MSSETNPKQLDYFGNGEATRELSGWLPVWLIICTFLGVFSALFAPQILMRGQRRTDARLSAAQTEVALMAQALNFVRTDTGRYPTPTEGLAALTEPPSGMKNWKGPYSERPIQNDPWGYAYIYRFPGRRDPARFDLLSVGPDGKVGTADDINAP